MRKINPNYFRIPAQGNLPELLANLQPLNESPSIFIPTKSRWLAVLSLYISRFNYQAINGFKEPQ